MLAAAHAHTSLHIPHVNVTHVSLTCGPSTPLREGLQKRLGSHQEMCDALLDLMELLLGLHLAHVKTTSLHSLHNAIARTFCRLLPAERPEPEDARAPDSLG